MIGEFKTKSPQHADLLVATHPDVCNGKAMGNTLPVTPHILQTYIKEEDGGRPIVTLKVWIFSKKVTPNKD